MKIFVLGTNGMLGRYVYTYFKSEGYDVVEINRTDINATDTSEFDISAKLYRMGMKKGDVVINCIGLIKQRKNVTKLDFIQINSTFPLMLANVCEQEGAHLIHPSTDCFLPKTKILTLNGYTNIEDIYVDDLIYTHTGKIKKVIDVLVKTINEEIYEIKTLGNDTIYCTSNHPWYGIKRHPKENVDFDSINWLKTEDLCNGSLISIPKIILEKQTITFIDLLDYSTKNKKIYDEYKYFETHIKSYKMNIKMFCRENNLNYRKMIKWNNDYTIKPKISKFDNILNVNSDLMWLLGVFLAEGWVNNKKGRKVISLSFGDEKELIERVYNIIVNELKITPSIKKYKNQKGCQLYFSHQLLSEFLAKDFYISDEHFSHTKSIPIWVKNTGKENIIQFIKGYFDGDGCFSEKLKTNFISMSSVSEKLIDDLKILFMMIGFLPNKSMIEKQKTEVILGREVNVKNKFTLTISGKQLNELLNYFDIKNCVIGDRYNKFFQDDNYWYAPITNILKTKYKGVVYNLEVEDDHSYLVNGGLSAHNCVYDGLIGEYNEESKHDADDVYGITKSLGEPENATVIRTSIIGEELQNQLSFVEWVKSEEGNEVNGFINHKWNGVTCLEFSKICEQIIKKNLYWNGVVHLMSPETISKYKMVEYVSDVYDLGITIRFTETPNKCDRSLSSIKNVDIDIKDLKVQIQEMKDYYNTLKDTK